VVRPGANGVAVFSLDTNGDGVFDAGDQVFSFGLNSDTFLVGDWNGDGKSKIGVVRPGANGVAVFSLDTNGDGAFDAGDQVFSFGLNGDKFLVGRWKPAGSPLVAADGALNNRVQPLAQDAVFAAAVNAAIDEWARAGLDAQSLTRLRAARYTVGSLGGATLGISSGDDVTIDADAAGHGWSVAGGTMDLTTALAHEMGHALGLGEGTTADPADVMFESLLPGARKAPTASDVDALFASL